MLLSVSVILPSLRMMQRQFLKLPVYDYCSLALAFLLARALNLVPLLVLFLYSWPLGLLKKDS